MGARQGIHTDDLGAVLIASDYAPPTKAGEYRLRGMSKAEKAAYPGKTCMYYQRAEKWACTEAEARAKIQAGDAS